MVFTLSGVPRAVVLFPLSESDPLSAVCVLAALTAATEVATVTTGEAWGQSTVAGEVRGGGDRSDRINANVKAVRLRRLSKTKHLLPSLPPSLSLSLSLCLYATMSDLHELKVTQTIWP